MKHAYTFLKKYPVLLKAGFFLIILLGTMGNLQAQDPDWYAQQGMLKTNQTTLQVNAPKDFVSSELILRKSEGSDWSIFSQANGLHFRSRANGGSGHIHSMSLRDNGFIDFFQNAKFFKDINFMGNVGIGMGIVVDNPSNNDTGLQGPEEKLHIIGGNIKLANIGFIVPERAGGANSRGVYIGNGTDHAYFGLVNRSTLNGTLNNSNQNNFDAELSFGDDVADNLVIGANLWDGSNHNFTEYMRLAGNGNFGIGTSSPQHKLHVEGNAFVNGNNSVTGESTFNGKSHLQDSTFILKHLLVGPKSLPPTSNNLVMRVSGKFRVERTAEVKELHIDPTATWADFVFEEDYDLPEIEEVADFIAANKHLPDMPSAQEVSEEGYNQSEINALLLQKIEELTLYVIDLKKENDELKASMQSQQK